jgi:thiol-disulfide isomerase/thioredoxin
MKPACWFLLLLLAAGCEMSSATSSAPTGDSGAATKQATTPVEDPAPASTIGLDIVSYEGILKRVAKHRGKVVVMDAWSTSCPPCIKEFHNLVELHKRYGPDQVACISLSFDYEGIGAPEEQREPVLKFLRGQGATFDNLMSNEESDVLYKKFDLAAVPAVFVYDRSGQLRKRFDNQKAKTKEEAFTYEQVKQLVAELLKEPAENTK